MGGALCTHPQQQTLIPVGMCMMKGGRVHSARCGPFLLCGWLFMWLPNLTITVEHTWTSLSAHTHTHTHTQTQKQTVYQGERACTVNTHRIPMKGRGCNDGVCTGGVAAVYSQTFIRRQAIREEWTILALHFCQSTHKHTHRGGGIQHTYVETDKIRKKETGV